MRRSDRRGYYRRGEVVRGEGGGGDAETLLPSVGARVQWRGGLAMYRFPGEGGGMHDLSRLRSPGLQRIEDGNAFRSIVLLFSR